MNKSTIYINKNTLNSYKIDNRTEEIYSEGYLKASQEFYKKYGFSLDASSVIGVPTKVIREGRKVLDKHIVGKKEYKIVHIYPIKGEHDEIDTRRYEVEFY